MNAQTMVVFVDEIGYYKSNLFFYYEWDGKSYKGHKSSIGMRHMWKLIETQLKLVPELTEHMLHRLRILQMIEHNEPIGRRTLARLLNQTERVLRSEVDVLKAQGLLDIKPSGMYITHEGKNVLHRLYPIMIRLQGNREQELKLARLLQIERAYIVPGDSSTDRKVQREIGRMASQVLLERLIDDDRVAVTGGSTLAAMAEMLYSEQKYPKVQFYPARGGLGEQLQTQANQIAAALAEKLNASYIMLQIPDHLSSEAYERIIEEPYIRERLEKIRSARLVFHGIGNAIEMAKKRNASREIMQLLIEKGAICEAFGTYFDEEGQIVYQIPTIGLTPQDLQNKQCIAVAGGSEKALAIRSLAKASIFQVLITDQGSADAILNAKDR